MFNSFELPHLERFQGEFVFFNKLKGVGKMQDKTHSPTEFCYRLAETSAAEFIKKLKQAR